MHWTPRREAHRIEVISTLTEQLITQQRIGSAFARKSAAGKGVIIQPVEAITEPVVVVQLIVGPVGIVVFPATGQPL